MGEVGIENIQIMTVDAERDDYDVIFNVGLFANSFAWGNSVFGIFYISVKPI